MAGRQERRKDQTDFFGLKKKTQENGTYNCFGSSSIFGYISWKEQQTDNQMWFFLVHFSVSTASNESNNMAVAVSIGPWRVGRYYAAGKFE